MTIRADHLTRLHPQDPGRAILEDVSFALEKGTITLLVGQTGAGKSTLLDLLTGLCPPDQGTVSYDGTPLWEGKTINRTLQTGIGVVFQYPEHQLFARTVQGEFDYSLKPLRLPKAEAEARIRNAMAELGLDGAMRKESPLLLSGGQKRRVALGSTFATEPAWLFLDEPTAGLDPEAVAQLCAFLQKKKQGVAGGIVIATHDLDALFPIADRVLVLDRGRLAADRTPQELCEEPDVLQRARIGLPSSTQIAKSFAADGLRLPAGPVSPEEMAAAIEAQLKGVDNTYKLTTATVENVENSVNLSTDLVDNPAHPQARSFPVVENIVHKLDPRAKWAFYLLLSVGIFWQHGWLGLLVGTLLTAWCVKLSGASLRDLYRLVKPFLFFIVLSFLLSGVRFGDVEHMPHLGSVGFDLADAAITFKQVYKILPVMILGLLLPATTSQLKMKRGLEQGLSVLARLKMPTEAIALGASLMLRFIPVILLEQQRMSRIVRARGKSTARVGSLRLRDVRAVTIPLLLAVLQLGEDLSLAMEARGYSRLGQTRTSSIRLQMQRSDWLVMMLGGICLLLMLAIAYWQK